MTKFNKISLVLMAALTFAFASGVVAQTEFRVPGFTAYVDPLEGGAQINDIGVADWKDAGQKVLWGGEIKTPGALEVTVALRLPAGAESKLRLTVAGKALEAVAKGRGDETVNVPFGSVEIASAGFQKFILEDLNASGVAAGDIRELVLSGPASAGARFNLKSRRNTASVHLAYSNKPYTNVTAFYCEVTATETPLYTYFEACGWHRGYFGMQVNSPTERRIIFSVWDSGSEAVDRSKVGNSDRVSLIAKTPGVVSGDFGNEGTGGHSHFVYDWKTGSRQRFVVTAKPMDATHTIYAGYWFHPEQQKWMLISSWKAPKDGAYLHGLYSFVENFGGDNGYLNRKALYGNQWLRTADGEWHEVTTSSFSHDPTGRKDRFDRFMGVENGDFFLSTGGFLPGTTTFGEKFDRPATGKVPADLLLPPVKE